MAVVVFKEIKPSRLNSKAMADELLKGMTASGKFIKTEYEKTTRTWEHKVKFEVVKDIGPKGPEVLVGTDDEIYGYVDKGTRPHIIRPKRAKSLAFQSNYKAKTTPNIIGSRSGGPSGPKVYTMKVNHPGTKARNFSKIIQKKSLPRYKRIIEQAMKRARQKSGHTI